MRKIAIMLITLMVIGTGFLSGCENVPKEITPLSIVTFASEPSIINQGEYANLSWAVIGASSVNINNEIGVVTLSGNLIVQPKQTTTYILAASNATITKNAMVKITVKPAVVTITDGIGDVSSVDYLTGDTSIVTSSPYINVDNLDLVKAIYTQQGTQATLSLQVKGNIENRGNIMDLSNIDNLTTLDSVDYKFQLSTSAQDYSITYSNKAGQLAYGDQQINLTSSDFSVVGNTLTVFSKLVSANETYTNLSVTSTYIKANLKTVASSGMVYLSDVAPNPSLAIYEAYVANIGSVGESIQFNASVEPLTGQPPYTCYWDFGDQGTSTQLNPTHVYTKAGIYTYTFIVTDQTGDTASQTGTITIIA